MKRGSVRRVVPRVVPPARCNRLALYINSRNGYRLCRDCWNRLDRFDDTLWADLRECGPLVDRCDRPVDGLGAQRMVRR